MTTIATNARVIRIVHGNGQGLEKWRKVIAVDVATVLHLADGPTITQGTVYLVPTMRPPCNHSPAPWSTWALGTAAVWISNEGTLLEDLDRLGAALMDTVGADQRQRIIGMALANIERSARREAESTARDHNYDEPDTTRFAQVHKFIQECWEGRHQ